MRTVVLFAAVACAVGGQAEGLRFVAPERVTISDAFWSPKFETWRTKTVPDVLGKLETRSHALENFDKAAAKATGGHVGACFFDGLYYETLRGASDYLARWPSPELEARLDRAIDRIVAAQLPDGYLHTWVQLGRPEKRWGDGGGCLLEQHEIYDAGALVEAGVHHYRATGKVKLLAAGIRFANLLCDTIGPRPKRNIIPTHSIAEEALVKLARLLKDEPALAAKAGVEGRPDDYLALVKFWFDNHGVHCGEPEWEVHGSHSGGAPYAMEIVKRMTGTAHGPEWRPCWGDYQMDRVPLDRYASIEGHAVRATLLCTGLASYAYETGDGKCAALASRFWESMVGRKMYVTGGVGARSDFERFGDDWELPPDAYLETCAAIGSAFFSGWMAALTGEGRYMDEFERVIYNALLTAVAEDGCHYTYQNPLNTARGERWDWHGCPCCPPMFLKLTGALPGYVYASDAEGLRVNLFIGGEADCTVGGQRVILRQTTRYPDEGVVEISVAAESPVKFPLRIRIPGWARGVENPFGLYASDGVRDWSLTLNGAALKPALDRGYAVVDREWRTGDKVTLTLDVSPRTIRADARVKDVAGCHAVARGPVVMAEEKGKTIPYWQVANGGPAPHQVWLKDAQPVLLEIGTDGREMPSALFGVFYEDVNCAADGGLYAELVKNRSFEFPDRFAGWRPTGNVTIREDGPFARCPHYARLAHHPKDVADAYYRLAALQNDGFDGIFLRQGETYDFSVWARCPSGGEESLQVVLSDPRSMGASQTLSEQSLRVKGSEWKRYTLSLVAPCTIRHAVLRIGLGAVGGAWPDASKVPLAVDVDHVSLFPRTTWRGRGLRADIAQKIADLKPGVFRFPGGCIIEGTTQDTRYSWKDSVGPVENRPLNEDLWNYWSMAHLTPDYYWTYGIGYYELFQFAEDLGAIPLPCVSVGLPCQFRSTVKQQTAKDGLADLEDYIRDAIDLVEFANGAPTTKWGAVRAQMGHPAPFNLKYLGLGNEQWDLADDDPAYSARLRQFAARLRAACPDIELVGSIPCTLNDEKAKSPVRTMRELGFAFVDEHFYKDRATLGREGLRFDAYDRKGPKIFAGEYACLEGGRNFFGGAIMDAAFLTGVERNCDIVRMSCYAPTLLNAERWQWQPALIWFDREKTVDTSSYLVQKMYAENRGVRSYGVTLGGQPVAGQPGTDGLFASAVERADGALCVRVVNAGAAPKRLAFARGGKTLVPTEVRLLACGDPDAENTMADPTRIAIQDVRPDSAFALAPQSFAVFEF